MTCHPWAGALLRPASRERLAADGNFPLPLRIAAACVGRNLR
jgi:hypothetical protein